MKITAIHGGGDWYDASADYLVIPPDMDLDAQKAAWRVWYSTHYRPALRGGPRVEYIPFVQWVIANGGREATEDEIEVYEDA
jgi:hypothetical protein